MKQYRAWLIGNPDIVEYVEAEDEQAAKEYAALLLQGEAGYVHVEEAPYTSEAFLNELRRLAERGVLR